MTLPCSESVKKCCSRTWSVNEPEKGVKEVSHSSTLLYSAVWHQCRLVANQWPLLGDLGTQHHSTCRCNINEVPNQTYDKGLPIIPWDSLNICGPHFPIISQKCREEGRYALIWNLRCTKPEITLTLNRGIRLQNSVTACLCLWRDLVHGYFFLHNFMLLIGLVGPVSGEWK